MNKRYWQTMSFKYPKVKFDLGDFIIYNYKSLISVLSILVLSILLIWTNETYNNVHEQNIHFMASQQSIIDDLTVELKKVNQEKTHIKNQLLEFTQTKDQIQKDVNDFIMATYLSVGARYRPYDGNIDLTILSTSISKKIMECSEKYEIPYQVIVGVIKTESQFNPELISKKGARGLMQVMFNIHGKMLNLSNRRDLHKLDVGIDSGCKVLRMYLNQTENNMIYALYKYFGGPDPMRKKPAKYQEDYVDSVYASMGSFEMFRLERDTVKIVPKPEEEEETEQMNSQMQSQVNTPIEKYVQKDYSSRIDGLH